MRRTSKPVESLHPLGGLEVSSKQITSAVLSTVKKISRLLEVSVMG